MLVNDPAVAVKLAVVAPEMTVTDDGTETLALLELKAMTAPEPGAGWLRVTVQADVPLGLNDAGIQLKADTCASETKVRGAEAVPPFSEAVI